jgi:hypothetical protein
VPSFDAVYVSSSDDERIVRAFEAAFPTAGAVLNGMVGSDWVQLQQLSGVGLEEAAAALGEALGCRTLSFASHTAVDYVEVHLYSNGQELRHLSYAGGGDRWEVVQGAPQRWEQRLFGRDDDAAGAETDLDRQVLSTRRLARGASVPSITPFDMGCALDLPGFSSADASQRQGWRDPVRIGPALADPRVARRVSLAIVGVFLLMLVADALWLQPASWVSTLILFAQLAFLFGGLAWAKQHVA